VPRPALHGVLGAGGRPLLGLHRSPEHPDTELKANPGGFAIKFLMSEELATRVAADPVRLTWYAQIAEDLQWDAPWGKTIPPRPTYGPMKEQSSGHSARDWPQTAWSRGCSECAPGRIRTCDTRFRRGRLGGWSGGSLPRWRARMVLVCSRGEVAIRDRLRTGRGLPAGWHPLRGHALTAAGPFDDGWLSRAPALARNRSLGLALDRRPPAVRTLGGWEGLPGGETRGGAGRLRSPAAVSRAVRARPGGCG
jgi:hypothetical protein